MMITDIAPGHISIRNNLRGPNYATVSACASSTHALIDAFNTIRLGKADVVVTGGSEAAVVEGGIGGFNALKALSTRNDEPARASRPFDATRDGFVLGEGAEPSSSRTSRTPVLAAPRFTVRWWAEA